MLASTLRPRRGIILVIVLWIVVILSLIAYSLLYQMSVETSVTVARKKELEAEALARAGVAKAVVDLRNDLLYDHMTDAKQFDGEGDVWARPEEHAGLNRGNRNKDQIALGEDRNRDAAGYFSVRVTTDEGLLALNRMGNNSRPLLVKIMEQIGYTEEDAEIAASAIIDWRDGDRTTQMPNTPDPNEGIAYAMLMAEDRGERRINVEDIEPIVLRNEDFLTVDELLEVYGVTPDLYFGPGTPEAEHYNRVLERKTGRQAKGERFQVDPPRRRRDERVLGLRDYFTIYSHGALNINHAPEHVLDALAMASGAGDEGWGESVVKMRRGAKREDLNNNDAFKDNTDIQAKGEVAGVVAAARGQHPVGVRSEYFRIVSVGVVGDVRSRLEVLVHRRMMTMSIDESFEFPERADPYLKLMEKRFKRRINKDNANVINYPFVRIIQMVKD